MDNGQHGHLVQLSVVLVSNNVIVRVYHLDQIAEIIHLNSAHVVKQIASVLLVKLDLQLHCKVVNLLPFANRY